MLLSLQLFSAKNYTPYTDVITQLGAIGYPAAEGFFDMFNEAAAIRAKLDAAGMTMPTLHVPIDMCENDAEGVAKIAATLGVKTVYAPWLSPEERPTDAAGWEALAERLAKCHAAMASHGLAFGWHNHDFEFFALPDGQIPMEILLRSAPMIEWEADIAWIVRSGTDPIDWISRHGQRITAAHFKDLAPAGENLDEDGWADAGTGTLDWPAIYAALKTSRCAVLVAEHDNPSDFVRFAKAAHATFATL
ncbi:sugar phosphate isomerase/epimerase [Falsirhodobacter sp. alg1]|uniref:sugar phosphate isomerase/epimerase family protein n=1 Tax=Falsirhodobacter sp. alg1 TaxID=1472418 RepID=UPI000786AE08|nr:sugar phosphate isomerase/epimerase [Falsirhodobacter sp. alg1]